MLINLLGDSNEDKLIVLTISQSFIELKIPGASMCQSTLYLFTHLFPSTPLQMPFI